MISRKIPLRLAGEQNGRNLFRLSVGKLLLGGLLESVQEDSVLIAPGGFAIFEP